MKFAFEQYVIQKDKGKDQRILRDELSITYAAGAPSGYATDQFGRYKPISTSQQNVAAQPQAALDGQNQMTTQSMTQQNRVQTWVLQEPFTG